MIELHLFNTDSQLVIKSSPAILRQDDTSPATAATKKIGVESTPIKAFWSLGDSSEQAGSSAASFPSSLHTPGSHKRGVCNANYLETP